MVLVTSANGRVGRQVVRELIKRGFAVRATDINPAAESLKELGVSEVLVGDARKPEFVRRAMAGATQVVYVPPLLVYDETDIANLAVDEALAAGVEQFVQLSVAHINLTGLLQHVKKLYAEEHLKLQGFRHEWNFTILQPLHYAQNVPVEQMLKTGRFVNFKPLNRRLGYVDGLDVAEAAAVVLSQGERHKYASYELCGSSFVSILDIAGIFERLSGVKLETVYIERAALFDGEFANFCNGANDSYARAAVQSIRDVYNDYGFAANKNVLEWLIGRESTTMEQYIARELMRLGHPARMAETK